MADHIIEKQLLEIRQKSTKSVNFDKISTLYNTRIVPLLHEVFDRFSDDSKVLRIDRLEIDAGQINMRDFEREFPQIVRKAVSEKITKLKVNNYYSPKAENIKQISQHESDFDLIKHFLEHGNLPWWAASDKTEIGICFKEVLNKYPQNIRKFILENIDNERLVLRLISQFDSEIINTLIALLFNQKIHNINNIVSSVYQMEEIHQSSKTKFERSIYRKIFSILKENILSGKDCTLTKEVLTEDSQKKTINIELTDILNDNNKNTGDTDSKTAIKPEEFHINNSGLVLLFPYILSFFKNLNLLSDNHFRNFESTQKAIHLLQYLASGETERPEYFLTLNKILCGIDINFPVEKNVILEETEKKEADELLNSVIKNWPAIKNTSPSGLRDAFIKRNGILLNEEFKWVLKVERKTYDILLEKMPWSYSIINFPWMKKTLYIEW